MNLYKGEIFYSDKSIQYKIDYVKRKTLEISVHPNTGVVVKAPVGTDYEKIKQAVIKRAVFQKERFLQSIRI